MCLLKLENVYYSYKDAVLLNVLTDVNAEFESGKIYSLLGKRSSGKTSLLALLGGLDIPRKGNIYYKDSSLSEMNLEKYRSEDVGFIYKDINLINHYTVKENLYMSIELLKLTRKESKARLQELLDKFNISRSLLRKKCSSLDFLEQQKVSLARACASRPSILLADEPTGLLSIEESKIILNMLHNLAHNDNLCVIIATGNENIAEDTDLAYSVADGIVTVKNFNYTKKGLFESPDNQ